MSAGLLHLPLSGLLFPLRRCGSGGPGPLFFYKLAEEKREGAKGLLKMQKQWGGHAHLQDVQKPSQDEWCKTQDTMEATLLVQKNPNLAILDLHGLGSARAEPTSVTSWRATS